MKENIEIKICNNSESRGHTRVQWALALLANLSYFTYGLQTGWISPTIKILQSVESPVGRPLSDTEISFIAGVPCIAALLGIVILLYIVEKFGRKYALLVLNFFQSICWIIKLCSSNPESLFVARIFCGIGAGGCFHVVPMYIKEISQNNIRGSLASIGVLVQNLGVLLIYILGAYLDYHSVLYCVVGIPILIILLLIKAPESPSFLVKKGKLQEAAATVAFLRGLNTNDSDVTNEIDSIKKEDDYFNSIPNVTFFNIFKEKAWRRGFVIMFMIFTVQSLNGAFPLINYASTVLVDSGVNISPELQTLSLPIALIIGTLFTMGAVDRLGRKMLLGTTFFVTSLCFSGLATLMLLRSYGFSTPGWLSIVAIVFVVFSYGAGVRPIPFIILSEIFNFQVRAKLMALLTVDAWVGTFVQLVTFTAITNYLGAHGCFYILGAINVVGAVIAFIFLPETARKSVEQIENELRKGKKMKKQIIDQ